ncbi:putative transcriptional regulator PhnF [Andreprevotia sp. IGB-42]|uniref:phosphonate metabolism transcriptional regulator PhnF n=1 Tax=Andreprevotia sp. IGB-42 TaxID=2497473 RepID=UPI00135A6D4E|nr:phosphonate metabolism transcriptional regulator PhnF [Andreprevotia sp. IGB-42]KAF0813869.1 putative transcriptional regulator PhnF [Andreprevotia sp. IGB-42]
MIQRGSGVAVWRQIEQTIEAEISRNVYKPSERLPTEAEFAARFEVNRHTIRRAIAALESRGLVRVEQGRGIFLLDYAVNYNVGKRTRFSETLRQQKLDGSRTMLRALEVPATPKIAQALALQEGERVLQIDTVGRADGRVINFATHYFPAVRFAGLAEAFEETGSITEALKRYGVADYERVESRITARMPDDNVARLLQQTRNQPVLQVEGINVDQDGTPIEYGIGRFAGDAVQLIANNRDL